MTTKRPSRRARAAAKGAQAPARGNVNPVVEGQAARIAARGGVVDRTAGAFESRRPAPSAEDLRTEAERAIAEAALERMRS